MKKITYILPAVLMALGATAFVSCDDMLDMGNDDVLYTNDNTLQSANDTVNTFVGILYQMQKEVMRDKIINKKIRPDGRDLEEVRPVSCEVGILPRTHGSGLFTRGQTQILTVTTLGSMGDELSTTATTSLPMPIRS